MTEAATGLPLRELDWDTPLARFSRATGLAVSLFDRGGSLLSGPHASTPLTAFLSKQVEDQDSACRRVERALFERALTLGAGRRAGDRDASKVVYSDDRKRPLLFALPLRFETHTIGVFVAGWVFDFFPDPLICDRLAQELGVPFAELWALIRRQAPISREKLTVFSELLQTLADTHLAHLKLARADRQTAQILTVLNRSAAALNAASGADAIGAAAVEALQALGGDGARLRLVDADGVWRTAATRGDLDADDDGGHGHCEKHHHNNGNDNDNGSDDDDGVVDTPTSRSSPGALRIPINAPDGDRLGVLETRCVTTPAEVGRLSPLSALASQVAVALQRARLIDDLEQERAALRTTLDELQRANRLKDRFLSTISHELRTPLNAILGWTQILSSSDDKLAASERRRAVDTIERNALAQAQLIDDLLDTTRIVSGKLRLDLRPLDLLQVLRAAVDTAHPTAQLKAIDLKLDSELDALPHLGDPQRLQQVFWNLLSNALKFTPRQGRVTVRLRASDERVEIEFRDTGPGVDEAFIPRLFDPFSQADGDGGGKTGLGLGLAIAKQMIELHGGGIGVVNADGGGAAFTVELPRSGTEWILPRGRAGRDAADVDAADADAPRPPAALTGLRVLVIEDTDDSRRLLVEALGAAGAQVDATASARRGFERLRARPPDVLVCDIGLPDENGYALMRRVRALASTQGGDTPAVAITAYVREADRRAALQAGFQEHQGKPIDLPRLIATIAALAQPPAAADADADGRSRLLVVDDHRDAAEALSRLLDANGYQVRSAFDGAGALAVAEEFAPDVVLLDINLPDLSGYQVAERLRAGDARGTPLIIALTGQLPEAADDDQRHIDRWLVKPVALADLLELLQSG